MPIVGQCRWGEGAEPVADKDADPGQSWLGGAGRVAWQETGRQVCTEASRRLY